MRHLLPLTLALAGCVAPAVTRDATPDGGRDVCYARAARPAPIEVTVHDVVEAPALRLPDGTVLREEVRAAVTEMVEVDPAETDWFEAPCPLMAGDPSFVRQVQRALAARDLYGGPIHGRYDEATRRAAAAFQAATGPASGWLSLASARRLGLIALGRDDA